MDLKTNKYNIIERRFAYLKSWVELSNSLNLTDVNIHAENFYRDFFNRLRFKFTNTNFDAQNFAHVDLIDRVNKQAIQITSRTDNVKIKEIQKMFSANQEYTNIIACFEPFTIANKCVLPVELLEKEGSRNLEVAARSRNLLSDKVLR